MTLSRRSAIDNIITVLAGYLTEFFTNIFTSIDYRLAQVRPFPAALEDCKCAVRYFRSHAAKYNIDPNRIGVWGGSVGGQMAGLLAVQGGIAEYENKLRTVIPFSSKSTTSGVLGMIFLFSDIIFPP